MSKVKDILTQLGEDEVREALGVSTHSIAAAKRERRFPSNWFAVIERMCVEEGIPCPRNLFAFRSGKDAA